MKFGSHGVTYYDSELRKRQLESEIHRETAERTRIDFERERKATREERALSISANVRLAADYIKAFNKYDSPPQIGSPLKWMTDEDEMSALREHFDFNGKARFFIERLFLNLNRPRLLNMLSEHGNLGINPNLLVCGGVGVLRHVFLTKSPDLFKAHIVPLFKMGYKLTEDDEALLNAAFENNIDCDGDNARSVIARWVITKQFGNSKQRQLLSLANGIDKIVYAIASLKFNTIIHFRFNSLLQVVHHVLHNRPECAALYIHAMKYYGHYDKLIESDKTKKLRMKLDEIESGNILQDHELERAVLAIFSDLNDEEYSYTWRYQLPF